MLSPFKFGSEVTAAELVDRVEEVATIERVLTQNERLFLIGPRRFGKTSILLAAASRARANGTPVISVNAEEFVTAQALASELVKQGSALLSKSLEKGIGKAAKFFRSLKPTVAYDPLLDHWTVGVSPDKGNGLDTTTITEALNGLEALAASRGQRIAIVVDEFQQVVAQDGINGERALRAVVQRHQYLAYVFAGSATTLLTAMTSDHNRPFYRLGSKLFLGPVPRADFAEHLRDGFATIGLTISGDVIATILNVSEDVPYNVQRLAHEIWTASRSPEVDTVQLQSVEDAVARLVATEMPTYGRLVSQLTPSQLKTLVAVAAARGGYQLTPTKTAKLYGMAVSTLRRALTSLEDKGLLRQDYSTPGQVLWRYEDPLFGEYVRRVLRV